MGPLLPLSRSKAPGIRPHSHGELRASFPGQETRIRASEKSPRGPVRCMSVTNHYGGEEVTHMLQAESPAEAQRWMEVFWQHFYDMSEWRRGSSRGALGPSSGKKNGPPWTQP